MTTSAVMGQSVLVKAGGAPLSEAVLGLLQSTTVDLAVGLPGVAVLRFREPKRAQEPGEVPLTVGTPVSVSFNSLAEDRMRPVFDGEVTSTEYEFDGWGSVLVVRCHDALHRLTRGTRTRAFLQVTDADVVRKVLQTAGLTPGTITATSVTHPHVGQVRMSDWDFLSARAREVGMVLVSRDRVVDLVPLAPTGPATRQLTVGEGITHLRVRVSSAAQVPRVEVRGWDPKTKRAVTGSAPTSDTAVSVSSRAASVARQFQAPARSVGTSALSTTAGAEEQAKGLAARGADVRADLEATALGDPLLVPRLRVELVGSTRQHDGEYVLTRVQHLADAEGYRTRVESTGSEDRGLRGLAGAAGSTGRGHQGVAVGVVTDIKDRSRGGQVKLKLPWLSEDYETDWVRVCAPGAGKERGLGWLPDVNDEVLVAFDHGDPRRPYVLGGLWNGRDAPPPLALEDDGKGAHTRRTLRSTKGHALTLSDDVSASEVRLASGGRSELVLDDTGKQVRLVLPQSGGTVTVDSQGKVVITGTQDVSVTSTARLLLEGKTGVEIKGPVVKIEGTGQVAVTGGLIKLN